MARVINRFFCLYACVIILAPPVTAQTVDLSTRTFWLGEHPRTLDLDFPFIALREIDWIDVVLENDPVLKDAVVQIEQEGMSVLASVARPHQGDVLLGPDQLSSQFNLPDYRIFGPSVATGRSFTYLPINPDAGFIVECGLRDDVEQLALCVVYATYAPDDRIRLKGRLYFPPDPADSPTYFRDVAERMREVTYCLDVTDEFIDVPVVHSKLLGCRAKPIS